MAWIPHPHRPHRRYFYVVILTGLFLVCMGEILHSPIDVLGGATPKHASAANEKLTGEYIVLVSPSLQPTSQAQQQFFDSFIHRSISLSDWNYSSFRIYVPSDNEALCTYAQHWANKLTAQHIAVRVIPMNEVMLRSRLLAGKYETAIVPIAFLSDHAVAAQQFHIKSYEMR